MSKAKALFPCMDHSAHRVFLPATLRLLKARNAGDIHFIAGGIIFIEDVKVV